MDRDLQDAGLQALFRVVPSTDAEAEQLAASIELAVHEETRHGVRDLSVEVDGDGVMLRGQCASFYMKQLAQHAAMAFPNGGRLINCIEVG